MAERAPRVESAKGSLRSLGGRAAGLSGRAADSLRSLPSRGLSAVVGAPSAPTMSRLAPAPSEPAPSASAPGRPEAVREGGDPPREGGHHPALGHYAAARRAQAAASAAPAAVPLAEHPAEPPGRCGGGDEGARLEAAAPMLATADVIADLPSLMGSSRELLVAGCSGLGGAAGGAEGGAAGGAAGAAEGGAAGAAHGAAGPGGLLGALDEPALVRGGSGASSPKLMMASPVAASRSCSASCWDGSPVLIPPTPCSAPPVPPSARASHPPAAAESPRSFDPRDLEALFASAAAPAAPAAPAAHTADPNSFGLKPWGCAPSAEAAAGSTHAGFGAASEPWPQAAPQLLAFPEGEAFALPPSTNLLD